MAAVWCIDFKIWCSGTSMFRWPLLINVLSRYACPSHLLVLVRAKLLSDTICKNDIWCVKLNGKFYSGKRFWKFGRTNLVYVQAMWHTQAAVRRLNYLCTLKEINWNWTYDICTGSQFIVHRTRLTRDFHKSSLICFLLYFFIECFTYFRKYPAKICALTYTSEQHKWHLILDHRTNNGNLSQCRLFQWYCCAYLIC